eukprot:13042086-Alexandrium_andersonii.AAC.1
MRNFGVDLGVNAGGGVGGERGLRSAGPQNTLSHNVQSVGGGDHMLSAGCGNRARSAGGNDHARGAGGGDYVQDVGGEAGRRTWPFSTSMRAART